MTYENYIIVRHNISIEFVRRQDGYVDLFFAYPDLVSSLILLTLYTCSRIYYFTSFFRMIPWQYPCTNNSRMHSICEYPPFLVHITDLI